MLAACIKMDTDADHSGEERIMFFSMYLHSVQAIVIEYPVIDPFCGSTLAVDFFVSICTAWNIRI